MPQYQKSKTPNGHPPDPVPPLSDEVIYARYKLAEDLFVVNNRPTVLAICQELRDPCNSYGMNQVRLACVNLLTAICLPFDIARGADHAQAVEDFYALIDNDEFRYSINHPALSAQRAPCCTDERPHEQLKGERTVPP